MKRRKDQKFFGSFFQKRSACLYIQEGQKLSVLFRSPALGFPARSATRRRAREAFWWGGFQPSHVPELVRLVHATGAMNAGFQPYILQFMSCVQGEGTSTVASGYAMIAAADRSKSVLLVDCCTVSDDKPRPAHELPTLIEAFRETRSTDSAIQPSVSTYGLSVARLSRSANPLLEIADTELVKLLELTRRLYPVIVLDCPPACVVPDSLALSRYADGTVLVVRAEATRKRVIAATKENVERFGGQVVGAVLNRRKMHIPGWLYRML